MFELLLPRQGLLQGLFLRVIAACRYLLFLKYAPGSVDSFSCCSILGETSSHGSAELRGAGRQMQLM